jgi:hypothetical protein
LYKRQAGVGATIGAGDVFRLGEALASESAVTEEDR